MKATTLEKRSKSWGYKSFIKIIEHDKKEVDFIAKRRRKKSKTQVDLPQTFVIYAMDIVKILKKV